MLGIFFLLGINKWINSCPLWMKNTAGHISKQRMLQPSSHHILAALTVSAEGTQDGNRMPAIKASATAAPQWWTLRRLRMEKYRTLAPESWGADQRDDFIESRLLHLPIHRKALNSLTWDVWFSLINSNLLIFQPSGPCCKTSYISLPPSLPLQISPLELSERLCPGLKSSVLSTK